MFTTLISATLFSVFAIRGAVAEFAMVTPPEISQCKPVDLSWEQRTGPYNVAIVPGNDPCGNVLLDLGDQDTNSMTWVANLPAGTSIMFSILDATDDDAWSGVLTILESDDASCLDDNTDSPSDEADDSDDSDSAPAGNTGARTTVSLSPTTTTTEGGATAVGAANAGLDVPFLSDGAASVHISMFGTAFSALVAVAVAAAL